MSYLQSGIKPKIWFAPKYNTMKCEELQLNMPLYGDNVLTGDEINAIERHLPTCPLCRKSLEDYRILKSEFRFIEPLDMPAPLNASIKSALNMELDRRPAITIATASTETFRDKFLHWLMPYSIGTVAATVFIFAFLFVLMSDLQSSVSVLQARSQDDAPILLANANVEAFREDLLLPRQYNGVVLATSPPELNPAGALVALTKSFVRGDMKDEEVVIVADVFGNGLAQIAEIVSPPDNERAMRELRKAFDTDPAKAPFKPSNLGKDTDRVRIVLKINRVEVGNTP